MSKLSTYKEQRQWLQDNGIKEPLPLTTLEAIAAEVDYTNVSLLLIERAVHVETNKTLPDEQSELRIERINEALQSHVDDAKSVLTSIRTKAGEAAIRRVMERERLAKAKQQVNDLVDSIREDANKMHSVALADFANAVMRGL